MTQEHGPDGTAAARRRSERAESARYHAEAQQRRRQQESVEAQVLLDRFVAEAQRAGLPTEELSAKPWSGSGRYRTGINGWYLRRDRSVGVDREGRYYELVVAPVRLGRLRGVTVPAVPPPLQVGQGARDGESATLADLLQRRLEWPG